LETVFLHAKTYSVVNLKNDGVGSLRYVSAQIAPGDTINFDSSLIANGSDSIVLTDKISLSYGCVLNGLQTLTDTLFISGGDSTLVLSFDLKAYTGTRNITINNLAIRNGSHDVLSGGIFVNNADTFFLNNSTVTRCKARLGGGIYIGNTSFISKGSRISSNSAILNGGGMCCYDDERKARIFLLDETLIIGNKTGESGGGIFGWGSKIRIQSSVIAHNISGSYGGGICASGYTGISARTNQLTVSDCLIEYNETGLDGGGAYIGAPSRVHSQSALTVFDKTTLLYNRCGRYGGGIYTSAAIASTNQGLDAPALNTVKVNRSTLAYNQAGTGGGGLACISSFTGATPTSQYKLRLDLLISNSTFYQNGSKYDSAKLLEGGQNIYLYTRSHFHSQSDFRVRSSILFSTKTNIFNNRSPLMTSLGYNAFSDSVLTTAVDSDIIGVDSSCLLLHPPAIHGGSTPTMLPDSTSVVIDLGDPTDTSQAQNRAIRGTSRDIGAAENAIERDTLEVIGCDSVFYQSDWHTQSVFLRDTLLNRCGYDSFIPVQLLVLSTLDYDTIAVCDSFTWGNVTYKSDTVVSDTFLNSNGCDSVVRLALSIYESKHTIDSIRACDEYTWQDGKTYKHSGTYSNLFTTSMGCDSITQLDLVIHNSNQTLQVIERCDSFLWLDGNVYHHSTDTPKILLTNRFGCDSLVQLDVTINRSSQDTVEFHVCDSIVWTNGQTYYEGNYTLENTYQNQRGCDSLIVTRLNVVAIDTGISVNGGQLIANETGARYQWFSCDGNQELTSDTFRSFSPIESGRYAVRMSKSGCTDTSRCIRFSGDACCGKVTVLAYPNPFNRYLKIAVTGLEDGAKFNVELYNAIGQLMAEEVSYTPEVVYVRTENWAKGVYILKVNYGKRLVGLKLIHAGKG
jgi:hypothetical protein